MIYRIVYSFIHRLLSTELKANLSSDKKEQISIYSPLAIDRPRY